MLAILRSATLPIRTLLGLFRTLSPRRRLALLPLPLALAGGGEALARLHQHPAWALALYGLAASSFAALAATGAPQERWQADPAPQATERTLLPRTRAVPIVVAFVACGLSLALFTLDFSSRVAWAPYLMSILAFIVAMAKPGQGAGGAPTPRRGRWTRRRLLVLGLLAGVTGFAAFLRLWQLDALPFGLWYDEAVHGVKAVAVIDHGGHVPLYSREANLSSWYLFGQAGSILAFGQSMFAIRLVSALFGIGTVGVAFLLGRSLFGTWAGLVFAFFMAVSRWDLVWSRTAMPNATTPFFAVLTMWLLLRAVRSGRRSDYLWTGLALGAGLWTYQAFRLFPFVAAGVLALAWWQAKERRREVAQGALVLGVAAVFVAAPLLVAAIGHANAFWGRTAEASSFNTEGAAGGLLAGFKNVPSYLLMFNWTGDGNGRHNLPGAPMLDGVTASLAVLGLAVVMARIRTFASRALLLWSVVMVLPGVFSIPFERPSSVRVIGVLPVVLLLATVALVEGWRALSAAAGMRRAVVVASVCALPLLGASAYFNFHTYFDTQANNPTSWWAYTPEQRVIAERVDQPAPGDTVYASALYHGEPTLSYLLKRSRDLEMFDPTVSIPAASSGGNAVYFLEPRDLYVLPWLQTLYPHASLETLLPPQGQQPPGMTIVTAPAEDIAGIQGLDAEYRDVNSISFKRDRTRTVDFDWTGGRPFDAAVARWSGWLVARRAGEYDIVLEGAQPALTIDGVSYGEGDGRVEAHVALAAGSHAIQARDTIAEGSQATRLSWKPPGGALATVPQDALASHAFLGYGLQASYYANDTWEGAPALQRIDRTFLPYVHKPVVSRPYSVTWEGWLHIDRAGVYAFRLEALSNGRLSIDGEALVGDKTEGLPMERELYLQSGDHPIEVRFRDVEWYSYINVSWRPPKGSWAALPTEALLPRR